MQSSVEFHEKLTTAIKQCSHETRDHRGKMPIGNAARQGDVYIHRIGAVPTAWDVLVTEHQQVALGATVGSRHIADGPAISVFWPKSLNAALAEIDGVIKGFRRKLGDGTGPCIGPVVVAERGWELTHPEHAHHRFDAGIYLTTYQLDRRTMRQVTD